MGVNDVVWLFAYQQMTCGLFGDPSASWPDECPPVCQHILKWQFAELHSSRSFVFACLHSKACSTATRGTQERNLELRAAPTPELQASGDAI